MYCPKCGCEYRKGYTSCSDCGIALVDETDEEKKTYCKRNYIKIIKSIISILIKKILSVMKSKRYLKFSSNSYKAYILFLLIFNSLAINSISFYNRGPGWEIPYGWVEPIKFTGKCALICLLLSVISFFIGFKAFMAQKLLNKIISVFWFVVSICFVFVSPDFIVLPWPYMDLIIAYWWVGILFPFLLFLLIMHVFSKVRKRGYMSN